MRLTALLTRSLVLAPVALLACSDPPPPTAQGGVYYEVSSASNPPSGTACDLPGGYNVGLGNPPPDADGEDPGKRIVDGEHSVSVSCSVSGDKTVTFNGEIKGTQVIEGIGNKPARLKISGTINEDGTGTGEVTVLTQDGFSYNNTDPCTLQGVVIDGKNQWGDDLVWTTFDCPLVAGDQLSTVCRARGSVVLEKCR